MRKRGQSRIWRWLKSCPCLWGKRGLWDLSSDKESLFWWKTGEMGSRNRRHLGRRCYQLFRISHCFPQQRPRRNVKSLSNSFNFLPRGNFRPAREHRAATLQLQAIQTKRPLAQRPDKQVCRCYTDKIIRYNFEATRLEARNTSRESRFISSPRGPGAWYLMGDHDVDICKTLCRTCRRRRLGNTYNYSYNILY